MAFAALWLVLAGVEVWTAHDDDYRGPTQWARRVNTLIPQGQPLYLVHLPENQIAYYLSPQLVRYDKDKAFLRLAGDRSGKACYAVTPQYVAERMSAQAKVVPLDRCPSPGPTPRERLTLVRIEFPTAGAAALNAPTSTTSKYASRPSSRSSASTGTR